MYLACQGNHEDYEDVFLNFSPPIVRDNALRYSFTEGNCFFVCMNLYYKDSDIPWMEAQLKA